MEKIKVLYIDDSLDLALSKYLDNYDQESCEFDFSDIEFIPDKGYESLINNPEVRSANVIFVDSSLFENRTANDGKFTGEEFKIILKKYFPFIEVIVITQNEVQEKYQTIQKYNPRSGISALEYYNSVIPTIMEAAIKNICESRKIALEMKNNSKWESILVEKIVNSLNGCGTYDELTKEDLDKVIDAFKEIQEKVDGR